MQFSPMDTQWATRPTPPNTEEVAYKIHQESGRLVVSVFDQQGALLRRIPAEVVLQMAHRLEQVIADRSLGLHAEV